MRSARSCFCFLCHCVALALPSEDRTKVAKAGVACLRPREFPTPSPMRMARRNLGTTLRSMHQDSRRKPHPNGQLRQPHIIMEPVAPANSMVAKRLSSDVSPFLCSDHWCRLDRNGSTQLCYLSPPRSIRRTHEFPFRARPPWSATASSSGVHCGLPSCSC